MFLHSPSHPSRAFVWFRDVQKGQSVGGVIVSLANFVAACSADPTIYWEENCPNRSSNDPYLYLNDFSFAQRYMVKRRLSVFTTDDSTGCRGYQEVDWGIFVYFLLGALVLAGCLIGYSWIDRLCGQLDDGSTLVSPNYECVGVQENSDQLEVSPRIGLELLEPPTHRSLSQRRVRTSESSHLPHEYTTSRSETSTLESPVLGSNASSEVFRLLLSPTACIFWTFFVTLSLFPGLTSELRSTRSCQTRLRLANDLYTPFSFVLFNVGDLCGRLLAARRYIHGVLSDKLVTFALLRFLFFPLIFLCPSGTPGEESHSVEIPSDAYSLLVQFSFAVSNGMLLTSSFAHAPTLLPRDHRAKEYLELMSEFLSFVVALGLLSGSLFAFPVSEVA